MTFPVVSLILTIILLIVAAVLSMALARLTHAVRTTAKEIQDLAAETSRHEQAVSRCVAYLQRCGTAPPTRRRAS